MVTPDVPQRWAELGGKELVGLLRGGDDQRTNVAALILRPVLADLRRQVTRTGVMSDAERCFEDGYEYAKGDFLDLLETGGSDGDE